MIWFKIKKLEGRLKSNEVSELEAFNYLIVSLVLLTLVSYLPRDDYFNKWLVYVDAAQVILVTVAGMKKTYDVNAAGDNADFLRRYLSLSFVAGIRLLVFLIPFLIVSCIVFLAMNVDLEKASTSTDIFYVSMSVATGVVYYYLLIRSFKRVAGAGSSEE